MLAASARARRRRSGPTHAEAVDAHPATLCGAAPFLAPFLIRHPDWLARLATDDLAAPRSAERVRRARWPRRCAACDAAAIGERLRQFKYYELARITVRDLWAAPDDARRHRRRCSPSSRTSPTRCSPPRSRTPRRSVAQALRPAALELSDGRAVTPRFCVLGMGKLGGEELNYSSDVDLIYVLESLARRRRADRPGCRRTSTTAASRASSAGWSSETTRDGFLYRIDLDLRPEGQSGPLVVPSDMLADYYDAWAATWEKAAFMKARPVAGDLAFGWRAIRAVDPMIYRSAMDFAGVGGDQAR